MGATFQYLLFLYWIFTTVEAYATWTDDCARGEFREISYSPKDNGTIVTIDYNYDPPKLVTLFETNFTNDTWKMELGSQPRPCDHENSARLIDVAIDSVSGVAYVTYDECGKIRAFDLQRSLFSTVYEDPYGRAESIATASHEGYLIWAQTFSEHGYTYTNKSIVRALLDGTEVKVLIHDLPKNSVQTLAVDQKTSLVYWTADWGKRMYQCDLQGNKMQQLDISVSSGLFTVHGNVVFWFNYNPGRAYFELYRTDVREPEKRPVYPFSVGHVEVLPRWEDYLDYAAQNPCENNPCAHICVRSSNTMGYTCLCTDDYMLEGDGRSCNSVRRRLLFSNAVEGIWQIPILNDTASEPELVVNTTSATGVQCDPVGRKIFWAEGDEEDTRIWQVDMENPDKAPEVVFKHSLTYRASHEELGAFALDRNMANLYMAFNGERRILVCGRDNESTNYTKCSELFSSKVGLIIGGLVLDPTKGTMYWAQTDAEDSTVRRGRMDGSWMETLKKWAQPKSMALGLLSRIYWLNQAPERLEYFDPKDGGRGSLQLSKYKSYAPQRIAIAGSNLYWTGLSKGVNSGSETIFKASLNGEGKLEDQDDIEKYVDGEFDGVTGFWMCDAEFEWKKRTKTLVTGLQCAGLRLSNGTDSFSCVCPMGFESHGTNGSSCKELEEPAIIYSAAKFDQTGRKVLNGSIRIKHRMNETFVFEGMVSSMAFDPVRTELFWSNYTWSDKQWEITTNGTFRLILGNHGDKSTQIAPQPFPFQFQGVLNQLECDWIGENLYFVSRIHRDSTIGLCSKETGECTIVNRRDGTVTIALDPPNGHMFWCDGDPRVSHSGIWRGHMDGSAGTVIIPEAQARFLTVDHTSKLLFWLQYDESSKDTKVFYSGLDGKNVRQTTRLHIVGWKIRVNGGRLWMTFKPKRSTEGILSLDKMTGGNLKMHKLGQHEVVADLIIQMRGAQVQADGDVCILGALCSHMCIPTPTGYMRCLCPTGYKLMDNSWTCKCNDADVCNATSPAILPPHLRPSPTHSRISNANTQADCLGNEFLCVGSCLGIDKLCNGILDCEDFSDEGDGCNEACKDKHGCSGSHSHSCSRSPTGPRCFCPPDQTLAVDNKSCVVLEIRKEAVHDGKLKIGLMIVGAVGVVLAIAIILVMWKYHQTKRERDLMQGELDEFILGDPAAASVAPDGVDRALLLPFTKVILPEDVIIAKGTKLGSGEFGIVHPGIFHAEPVAVKVLKQSVDVDEFKAVLAEVKIMAYLGDHEFVVKFVGAEISEVSKRKIMIVTELSPNGDLLKYLWKVASVGLETPSGMSENVAGNPSGVSNLTLYVWCEQITTGLEYLAQKQIVHGDLAARNVLVFKDNVVKIADFGLSKQLYGYSTYQMKRERKLPWKWSAIELLTSREFSEASDVWAFGVTAWEIFTLGKTPYKGIMIGNEFIPYIQAGHRLPKPPHASEEIFKVLLQCWDLEPRNRPNFQRLKEIFHDFVDQQRGCMQPVMNTAGSIYVTTTV